MTLDSSFFVLLSSNLFKARTQKYDFEFIHSVSGLPCRPQARRHEPNAQNGPHPPGRDTAGTTAVRATVETAAAPESAVTQSAAPALTNEPDHRISPSQ